MEFYGKSFPEAVQMLTGENGEGQAEATTAPPTAFHLPLHNRTADRAIQYLSLIHIYYGRLRKAYLEMHRPILFNELVLSDKLFEHCAEIDETARNRMELIVRSLAEQNGVTEQLKAENQMEWVRQMNACKAQAEEIVKVELIYD